MSVPPWSSAYIRETISIYQTSMPVLLGNMLEWLDFGIYAYSEAAISAAFFPSAAASSSSSWGWTAFGVGYACRPLGAYVLGKMADEDFSKQQLQFSNTRPNEKERMQSRIHAFQYAMYGMAMATAGIAFLPSACTHTTNNNGMDTNSINSTIIGTTATSTMNFSTTSMHSSHYCTSHLPSWSIAAFAIVLRCVQGFSAGAAAGTVNVIQSETSQSAQSVGLNNVSGALASILSAMLVYSLQSEYILGPTQYQQWGWRLAFLLVLPPSLGAIRLLSPSPNNIGHSNNNNIINEFNRINVSDDNEDEALLKSVNNKNFEYELSPLEASTITTTTTKSKSPSSVSSTTVATTDTNCNILEEEDNDDRYTTCSNHHSILQRKRDKDNQNHNIDRSVRNARKSIPMWCIWLLSIYIQFSISSYNNLNIYMVQYAQTVFPQQVSSGTATLMAALGKMVQLIMTPIAAFLADCYGWFLVCAIGATICTFLAIPLLSITVTEVIDFADSQLEQEQQSELLTYTQPTPAYSLRTIWILMTIVWPCVSTICIANAPLLVTSLMPRCHRSQSTSMIMAFGAGLAGFFPLLLDQQQHQLQQEGQESGQSEYVQSFPLKQNLLTITSGLGALSLGWMYLQIKKGRILLFQNHLAT